MILIYSNIPFINFRTWNTIEFSTNCEFLFHLLIQYHIYILLNIHLMMLWEIVIQEFFIIVLIIIIIVN
jgi:hypothetical protein